jgi:sec-independent protein translocase protein TatB
VPGFQELLVIGFVAVIVIGPAKLPKVAADVARLLARFRREAGAAVSDLKSQVPNDGFGDELRGLHRELRDTQGVAKRALRNELRVLTDDAKPATRNLRAAPAPGADAIDPADPPSAAGSES